MKEETTNANGAPINDMLIRWEMAEIFRRKIVSGERSGIVMRMHPVQSCMIENNSLTVLSVVSSEVGRGLDMLKKVQEKRALGLRIIEDLSLPEGVIEFQDCDGRKVGEIRNLAVPKDYAR